MAKFSGNIGYAVRVETSPGVWKDKIIVKKRTGDFVRNTSSTTINTGGVNDDIRIDNVISIIADPFAKENFHNIKYVEYAGAKWKINKVEILPPRLLLTTGGLYNG